MTVLVTGADGFIGSHITESLLQTGYTLGVMLHTIAGIGRATFRR